MSTDHDSGQGRPVHDVVGIGVGPFNLGLACLLEPLAVDALFLDDSSSFAWHPGMLLPDSTLQVPFLADLVSLADPTSPFSFLAWLKTTGRLYPFYIRENMYPLRTEFSDYCRWAADRLTSVRFGRRVSGVEHDVTEGCWVVTATRDDGTTETHRARALVLGTGTPALIPAELSGLDDARSLHSGNYLQQRDHLLTQPSVTVVGSGQSAAEIYLDLLQQNLSTGQTLTWVTRTPRFVPMEYTKLTLEMTSPDWTDHFHGLPAAVRDRLAPAQAPLHKGIDASLINEIFDLLYQLGDRAHTRLLAATAVTGARESGSGTSGGRYRLDLQNTETDQRGTLSTDGLVLATGYRPRVPAFLDPVRHLIAFDDHGRFDVRRDYRVDSGGLPLFVQNAEQHTHGFVAPDLGMAAYRNSWIVRSLTGQEVYSIERTIARQEFGMPADLLCPTHDPDLDTDLRDALPVAAAAPGATR